ncbi:unnamed protein product, partial [Urochloa humidicola]
GTAYKYLVPCAPSPSGPKKHQAKLLQAVLQKSSNTRAMASMKAVKITGAAAQAKETAPKLSETATKPSAAKSGVKKAEQKPREPKKKVKSSKPAAKK